MTAEGFRVDPIFGSPGRISFGLLLYLYLVLNFLFCYFLNACVGVYITHKSLQD
jgi:hypothetical protein